ncbi:MAG: hypothetical protein KDA29_12385 [Phycisphaerales bacterium]|nr:hypothetical protein [Phycisphaerales bacterium]
MTHEHAHNPIGSGEHEGRFMHEGDPAYVDRDIFGNAPKHHRDWSHRRGEPRVFALIWMLYLMGAMLVMFMQLNRSHTISYEIVRPAARVMLLIVVIGFSVLWPMLRLSQHHPRRGHVWFALRDAIVLFVPLQAILWPLATGVLTHWPVPVVAAMSLLCGSWMLLIAGVLALAMRSIAYNDTPTMRCIWMGLIILVVVGAPMIGATGTPMPPAPVNQPRVGWLLSPITGVLEILRDREAIGVSGAVFTQQIRMMIAIGCVGLALLLIARGLEVAHARVRA